MQANIHLILRNKLSKYGLITAGLLAATAIGCGRAEKAPPTAQPASDQTQTQPAVVERGVTSNAMSLPIAASAAAAVEQVAAPKPAAPVPATTEASMVNLRRQLYAFEQRFRAEDEVCAALALQNAALSQTISSNEAVMLNRLRTDAEWIRIRDELVEAQRAGDRTRMQRATQRRGQALTNAQQRNVIMLRPRPVATNSALSPRKEIP